MADRRLLSDLFLKPVLSQRRRLAGIGAALAVQAVSDGVILLMVKGFVNALFADPARTAVPVAELLPARALAYWPALQGQAVSRAALAWEVPCAILVGGVCRAVATYLYQLHQQALALYVAKTYRERLFAALLALPYIGIRRRQVGEWMSIIMNDVMFLQTRFSDILTGLVKDSVSVVWFYLLLWFVHWPTALVMLVLSPIVAFGMGRTGKRIAKYAEAFQRELARIAAAVLDLRARFDFIRAQHGEERERQRFAALNHAYYRMIRRSILIRSAFAPALELLGYSVFGGLIYVIGKGVWGTFSPEVTLQFFVALGLMLRPLREIGEQLSRFHETKGTLMNSLALFDELERGGCQAGAPTPQPQAAGGPAWPAEGLVIHRIAAGMAGDVRFAAENLRLAPGRAIAVVGPSGAGKSTLLKTLAGLVEPLAWDANLGWRAAAEQTSMVSQDPFLFDDTIAANLVYGLEAAMRPAEADVHRALATVNIDREVQALEQGLATRLRAIGSNVSGGQLQRLVIARGLLRGKPIWLLDEATSAVDARSERDITQRLVAACRDTGHALLAVTHRLTWLDAFDDVWFVEHGRVAFAGAHAALLQEPRYREYCAAADAPDGGDAAAGHEVTSALLLGGKGPRQPASGSDGALDMSLPQSVAAVGGGAGDAAPGGTSAAQSSSVAPGTRPLDGRRRPGSNNGEHH